MQPEYSGALPEHGRFDCLPITRRPHYRWPVVPA